MPLRSLILPILVPMLVVVWLWPGPANAMSPELGAAYQKFRELHAQHRYQDALPVAQKAVSLAEREYGPDHPNTATFLSNLATVYQGLDKDAEAESLIKRALAIYQKSPLSKSRHIVNVLGNYAALLRKMGRDAEAAKLEARAKQTKRKARARAALAKLQKKKPAGADTSDFKQGDFKKGLDAYLRKDYETALQIFKPSAAKGHSLAQFYMGILYRFGFGVPRNYALALGWWNKAARQGNFHAENSIGMAFKNGQGVKQNHVKAAGWFSQAADKGLAEAQLNLALAYFDGKGVAKDDVQAVKWFAKAAMQGLPTAQYGLGLMINTGRGVPYNLVEALIWYKLAASRGHRQAIKDLKKIAETFPPKLARKLTKAMATADRSTKAWKPEVQPDRGLPVWW